MKAFLSGFLGLLGLFVFSAPLRAEGPFVYFSGNVTTTEVASQPPAFKTATQKNYFLLDQSTYQIVRYKTFVEGGVKKFFEYSTNTLKGTVFPSSKTLKATYFAYDSFYSDANTTISLRLKGVPNAATGKAIDNQYGAYPSSLIWQNYNFNRAGAASYSTEEKGTLTVLRPLSKAANSSPYDFNAAKVRLVNELQRLGYRPL